MSKHMTGAVSTVIPSTRSSPGLGDKGDTVREVPETKAQYVVSRPRRKLLLVLLPAVFYAVRCLAIGKTALTAHTPCHRSWGRGRVDEDEDNNVLTGAGLPVREAAPVETVHDVFHLRLCDGLCRTDGRTGVSSQGPKNCRT